MPATSNTNFRNPIANTSSPLTEILNPRRGSDESSTSVVVDNEGAQEYELASVLSSSRRLTIKVVGNSDEGTLLAELFPEEITALYRQLSLKTELHDWQFSSSIALLKILQECMKLANKERLSLTGDASGNIWGFHIQFLNTLFPILDALADLEEMINREDKSIEDLSRVLTIYENKIDTIFNELEVNKGQCIHNAHDEFYSADVSACLIAIKGDLKKFKKVISESAHADKTKALLSNYTVVSDIKPLGLLVADQVKHVTGFLRLYIRAHEEKPGHFDYVEPRADYAKVRVLDDKLSFRQSLASVRFSPDKPLNNIAILRYAGGNLDGVAKDQKQMVNLKEFVDESKINFNTLETLLCAISGKKPLTVGYTSPGQAVGFILAITVATFIEVAITLVRLALSNVFLGLLAGVMSLFIDVAEFFSAENTQSLREYSEVIRDFFIDLSDKKVQGLHHYLSPLAYLRKVRDKGQREYYQASSHGGTDTEHDRLLENFSSKPKSSLAYIAASYLSASFVNDRITQGYQSIFSFLFVGMPEYLYEKYIRPAFSGSEDDAAFFERLILQSRSHLTGRSEKVNDVTGKLSLLANTNAPDELDDSTLSMSELTSVATPKFPVLCANPVGPSVSIIDFVELLVLEFSAFINGIFITHPLQATLSEAITLLAMSSFYVEWGGVAGEFCRWLIDGLSKSFTGEEASVSDMRIMLGSFLFWKLGVLAIELVKAIATLDAHFLEKIYGDPEKALLIVATFTALGYGLHALPLFPESINLLGLLPIDLLDTSLGVYLGLLNVFIEESRVATIEGQFPFNGLELFFLGLKAVFLLGSLVSGPHKPHLQEDLEKLKDLIQEINSLHQLDGVDASRALAAKEIIQLHDALGKPLDRKDARRLFDFLCKHDNDATKSLRKGLYDQSIFRGSNNFLQIFSIYPLYEITLTVRAITFVLAQCFGAHSVLHGLQKDFSAEAVMVVQIPAALVENFRSAVLAFSQLAKNSCFSSRVVASFINSQFECFLMDSFEVYNRATLDQRDWHDSLIALCKKGPAPLEIGYGVVSHIANTDEAHHEHDESHAESVEVVDVDAQPDVEIGLRKRPLTSCASAFTNCYSKTVGPCAKALEKSWQGGDVVNAMHGRSDSVDTEMGSVVSAGNK
jgi:hypothetical protein